MPTNKPKTSARAKSTLSLIAATGMSLVAATAIYLTEPWEDTKNLAYWDSLGKVWTVCTGETKGVKKGDRYTDEECATMLYETLERDYHQPLQKCIKGFDGLPFSLQMSLLDAAYNLGAPTICKSTAAKRAMSGDYFGSCTAVSWFDKAGGNTIRGLVLRRGYGDKDRLGELDICLAGLPEGS